MLALESAGRSGGTLFLSLRRTGATRGLLIGLRATFRSVAGGLSG